MRLFSYCSGLQIWVKSPSSQRKETEESGRECTHQQVRKIHLLNAETIGGELPPFPLAGHVAQGHRLKTLKKKKLFGCADVGVKLGILNFCCGMQALQL